MQLNFCQQVEVLSGVSKCILSLKGMAGLYFLCPPSRTLDIIVGASSDTMADKVSLRLEFPHKDGFVDSIF